MTEHLPMDLDVSSELLRLRRTRIIATLGPASSGRTVIGALIDAGVDLFRLNMSHGSHADHRAAFETVRSIAAERGQPTGVLADLCGPKIRVGELEGGAIELQAGDEVVVTTREVVGRAALIPTIYSGLAADVKPGDRILLDDGLLELRVLDTDGTEVRCEVVHGGTLRSRKGINLPGVAVSAPTLTDKDRMDAAFALELGVDYLALSFVRRASDVVELRELVTSQGSDAGIIAKIEKPEALDEIGAIIDAADGLMVARGDLGVELPAEQVPLVQDRLLELAREHNKPAIVATQMLESMIEHARPTRAEVSDVAHAVRTAADAMMLSGETAVGRHPVEAVRMMDRIARRSEGYMWLHGRFASAVKTSTGIQLPLADAVARATSLLSRDLKVRGIVVLSHRGTTVRMVSSARPAAPVIALTDNARAYTRMGLCWGVEPVWLPDLIADEPDVNIVNELPRIARERVRAEGLGGPGEHLLLVQGYHPDPRHNVPTISVVELV